MKKKSIFMFLGVVILSIITVLSSCKKDEDDKNNNPSIASVTVVPGSVAANGIATVSVAATDPDGDALTYSYSVSGGAIQGVGASATWTAPGQAGSCSVTVNVSDGKGGTASGNGSLTVTAAVTQITGTASFPAGTTADLSNSKVSIYTSLENWNINSPIKWGAVTGSGANVSFTLTNVNPGNYYLDVWKDRDNDGFWSRDDFVGWYGSGGLGSPNLTEFQVTDGQTFNCDITMFFAKGGSQLKK